MSTYIKPVIECINYRIEERLATKCTGCCPKDGQYYNPISKKSEWLVGLNVSS
jgi:hypothetical protein